MDDDPELGDNLEALEQLVEAGYIEQSSPAEGIARLFVHEGIDALTPKQRYVFNRDLSDVLLQTCVRCGEGIAISTLPDAYEQDAMLCSYHLYKQNKGE